MSPSSSSGRRHALHGVALASLFLLAQASSFTHRLVVQHATCAEHGELVHVDVELAEVLAAGVDREVRSAPPALKDHGHDHCLVVLPRREDFLPLPADGLIVHRVESPSSAPGRVVSALTSLERLLLAPKSSPPA